MKSNLSRETWQISKPAVTGHNGIVSTQHFIASEVGAEVLRQGGNAVDAAVAAGLAIGVVEPWSSGIGGGGYMTIYLAEQDETKVVEFGMRAPFESKRDDYPLDPSNKRTSAGSFNWPAVIGNVNVSGPLSIAVPGYIRGSALALERFGTQSWEQVIEPACQLAERGLPVDWFTTMHITGYARVLSKYPGSKDIFLPDGYPPLSAGEGRFSYLPWGNLKHTYRTLQREGPDAYYAGSLAPLIVQDLNEIGNKVTLKDLDAYQPFVKEPISRSYRGSVVQTPGNMTAGPSLNQALGILENHAFSRDQPSADDVIAYVKALRETYEYRLEHLGEGKGTGADSHTSHLSVADKYGNLVALTQTIMSPFGSHVVLPKTGLVMNNGMMWFDPMPDMPNSLEGGRHPLCNMCPTIIHKGDGSKFALGACGGRKIFPSVMQLTSYLLDFNMSINDAVHHPRIDVSGNENVWAMAHFDSEIIDALEAKYLTVQVRTNNISGGHQFAVPQIAGRLSNGLFKGGCFIPSPHAAVIVVEN